jgi:hypothetical protein
MKINNQAKMAKENGERNVNNGKNNEISNMKALSAMA